MTKQRQPKEVSKSVGALTVDPEGRILLIFQTKGQFWEFPKGKVEQGESDMETLKREIEEETGIKNFEMIDGFEEHIFYHFYLKGGERINREVVYYLIQTSDDVVISDEHTDFQWVEMDKAVSLLRHQNHKNLVRKAKALLQAG